MSQEKSFKEILRARDWNTRNKEFLFGEVLLRIHVVSEIKPKKNICFCLCISGAKCQSIFGTSEGPCLKVTDVYCSNSSLGEHFILVNISPVLVTNPECAKK